MTDEYLRISYQPGGSWLLTIMARLNQSSSATLRERMIAWESSPLSEMGLALATKLAMLPCVVHRVDQQLQRLSEQLSNESMINDCIHRGAGYPIAEKSLPYEILVDIDSFLFESRSAYEIVGRFLREFFKQILGRDITEAQLIELLEVRIPETRWIKELRENRIRFFHETAPWIALKIISKVPLRFELLVLKRNVKDFEDPNDYIHFEQLRSIYHGFIYSLDALHQWVIGTIEEFEVVEENRHPGRS